MRDRLIELLNNIGMIHEREAETVAEYLLDHGVIVKNDDVVEVVRCKDCKHYKEQKRRNGFTIYDCDFISGLFFDDDFCSRGERKEKKV